MSWITGLVCSKGCAQEHHRALVQRMGAWLLGRGEWARNQRMACIATAAFAAAVPEGVAISIPEREYERFTLVYDGTLFNSTELRSRLAQSGHRFRTHTDQELVLRAFAEWGDDAFARLQGMFAFALHDEHSRTLTLVRDHFGIKPLCYTEQNDHVYFASELKPLIDRRSSVRPNGKAIAEWFLYHTVARPEGLIEDIYSVPAGHFVRVTQGRLSSACQYYSPIGEVNAARYRELMHQPRAAVITELSRALDAGVQDCLSSDAPVGTLCSGGVDSSLMTAMAARRRNDLKAFHISIVDDPRLDERRQAEDVATHLGVPLISEAIDESAFRRDLVRVIYLNEAPLTHIQSVAFYHGAKLASAHGSKILLVGDTADAVLGGNWSRYGRQKQLAVLQQVFARLPSRVRLAIELTVYASKGMPWTSANFVPLIPHIGGFVDQYARRGLYLQCEEAYAFVHDRIERSILATKLRDIVEGVSWFFHRGDRLGMAASVEYRVPFMGHQVIQLTTNLPWSYHTRGVTEKWALKKIARQFLPHSIVYRKKLPWDLPLQRYIAHYAQPSFFCDGFCLEALGLHPKALEEMTRFYDRLLPSFFNLVNLEIWGRLFFMHESPEQIAERAARTSTPLTV